ncbi:MAG: hypothetical protein M1837_006938 [Sclerophora amabilis]|nr:MAG: hypothetical protein M1837_006938 [Sclerophora amabilis]
MVQNFISANALEPAEAYKRHVQWLANSPEVAYQWPGLSILDHFINAQQSCEEPRVQFTVLDIYKDQKKIGENVSRYHFASFDGPEALDCCLHESSWRSGPNASSEERLQQTENPVRGRLFVIENLCPESIFKLGGALDVDPHFWADYLETLPWYRITAVPPRLSALPSSRRKEHFLKITSISPRNLVPEPKTQDGIEFPYCALPDDDTKSYLEPDQTTTRVQRKAGLLVPKLRDGNEWPPVAFVRQSAAVWARQKDSNDGWIGIVLLDPVYLPQIQKGVLKNKAASNSIGGAEYREFWGRPSMSYCSQEKASSAPVSSSQPRSASASIATVEKDDSEFPSSTPREHRRPQRPSVSLRAAFLSLLSTRLSSIESFQHAALSDVFLLLSDLYFLVASEWLVADEYVNRELATIEYCLEKKMPEFRELQTSLQVLFIQRRRCTRYAELIIDAKKQCQQRGQNDWPRAAEGDSLRLAMDVAESLVSDFEHLHAKLERTLARIEKNIKLLTALVSIGEAEQALFKHDSVERLTVIAALYLPFSTVATVLAIPGNFGPGQSQFWIYWSFAVPLTGLVMALLWCYQWITAKRVDAGFQTIWKGLRRFTKGRALSRQESGRQPSQDPVLDQRGFVLPVMEPRVHYAS